MFKDPIALRSADLLPTPPLAGRPLLSAEQARRLMRLFKVFANDTRLRLL